MEIGRGRDALERARDNDARRSCKERGVILATVELLERPHGSHFRIKAGLGSVVLSSNFAGHSVGTGETFSDIVSAVTESGGGTVP